MNIEKLVTMYKAMLVFEERLNILECKIHEKADLYEIKNINERTMCEIDNLRCDFEDLKNKNNLI